MFPKENTFGASIVNFLYRLRHAFWLQIQILLGAIHPRRPVERRGGGVWTNVNARGGGVGYQPDVHERKKYCRFGVRIRVRLTPPPHHPCPRASGLQYILRFGRFLERDAIRTSLDGSGGVFQMDDVGQGRGVSKNPNISLWWMTPYFCVCLT